MTHSWIWEQFEDRPDYVRKHMFGCQAVYLSGRIVFCVGCRQPPWSGLLLPVAREHHASLMDDFSFLQPHPVLGKWLYLPDADDRFEYNAQAVLDAIANGDPRLGVIPPVKRRRRAPGSVKP